MQLNNSTKYLNPLNMHKIIGNNDFPRINANKLLTAKFEF